MRTRVRRAAWVGVATSVATLALLGLVAVSESRRSIDVGSLAELEPAAALGPRLGGLPPPRRRLVEPNAIRVRSGSPKKLRARRRAAPVALDVPAIELRARRVVPVGVEGRARALALPRSPAHVGWYKHGPAPGQAGTAVLAAHANYDGRPGPFIGLERLEPGARVRVAMQRRRPRTFRIIARRSYDKQRLPRRLFAASGRPALALVTCGGPYDERTRTYARNTVVYAVPA